MQIAWEFQWKSTSKRWLLTSTASASNWPWNLEVLVFEEGGQTGGPGEKTLGARTRH